MVYDEVIRKVDSIKHLSVTINIKIICDLILGNHPSSYILDFEKYRFEI